MRMLRPRVLIAAATARTVGGSDGGGVPTSGRSPTCGIGARARARVFTDRGATVVGAGTVVGTVVGAVVDVIVVEVVDVERTIGLTEVVVVSSEPPSPPPPPPPESPPPPPPEGTVVEVVVDVVVDDVEVVEVVEVVDVVVGVSSSAFGAGVSNEYNSRLSEPLPALVTALRVADDAIADATSAGVRALFCDSASAATPATCGDAIEVPESVREALSDVWPADTMLEPGAKTSRHDPKLENDDRSSLDVVDPTVMALGSPAGDVVQALTLELPAATTKVTPSATPRDTAKSSAAERGPPRLMLATAGTPLWWCEIIQSMPAITSEVLPEPLQPSTRTGTIIADGATP